MSPGYMQDFQLKADTMGCIASYFVIENEDGGVWNPERKYINECCGGHVF